jgi:hypothetical protein
MMDCCQCRGCERLFDKKEAARSLRAYQRNGPSKSTRILLDALRREGVAGATLLDIGGGIGAVQLELLAAGVHAATDVDASSAYIEEARAEAERRGYAGQVAYHFGNFVDLAPEIAPADIVTLDRAICCYPDMPALVGASVARARRLYGLVYPRDTWWVRGGLAAANFVLRLWRNPFRVFAHRTAAVEGVVRAAGLEPRFHRNVGLWQVVVYARGAGTPA